MEQEMTGQEESSQGEAQYLTFNLEKEEYGLDILKVQEIRSYEEVTPIPNAPDFIKGVINLRGLIVPIVDMRIKFGLQNIEYTPFTVVIILNINDRISGVVVDGVTDVISLQPEQIKAAPEVGSKLANEYLIGFGKLDQRTLILLDITKLMTSQELQLLNQAAS